jgi:hypothetical protein
MDRIEIVVLILISISLVLPVLCIVKMRRLKEFKKTAIVTSALIRSVERRSGYKSVYYLLTVQYGDLTGKIFMGSAVVASKKHKPGDFVPLMYLPDNPAKYKTDFGKWLPWVLAFSLVFLGLIIWFCYWLLHIEYTIRPA